MHTRSIIPRAPIASSTSSQPLNQRFLDVYCGAPASFELYEDDGTSFDYEQGTYLTSRLSCTTGATTVIAIERTAGTWMPPPDRSWQVALHRAAAQPSAVTKGVVALSPVATEEALDGVAEGWVYTPDHRVVVKVADQSGPLTITVQP